MLPLIAPLTKDDVATVAALARTVWQDAYLGIITQAQIDFMLAQRYNASRLCDELTMADVWWDKATVDGQLAAFASTLRSSMPREMKLDKLYVNPARQRLGLGGLLIAHVAERALTLGCQARSSKLFTVIWPL